MSDYNRDTEAQTADDGGASAQSMDPGSGASSQADTMGSDTMGQSGDMGADAMGQSGGTGGQQGGLGGMAGDLLNRADQAMGGKMGDFVSQGKGNMDQADSTLNQGAGQTGGAAESGTGGATQDSSGADMNSQS